MGYPNKQTVGELLDFFQEQLANGKVTRETPVHIEIYLLSAEDAILKEKEDELGYHVPDDTPWDIQNFRSGVWEGGRNISDHTVALSCYVKPHAGDDEKLRAHSGYKWDRPSSK